VGSALDVYLASGEEKYVGKATVVRRQEGQGAPPRFGCRFTEKTGKWVLE